MAQWEPLRFYSTVWKCVPTNIADIENQRVLADRTAEYSTIRPQTLWLHIHSDSDIDMTESVKTVWLLCCILLDVYIFYTGYSILWREISYTDIEKGVVYGTQFFFWWAWAETVLFSQCDNLLDTQNGNIANFKKDLIIKIINYYI